VCYCAADGCLCRIIPQYSSAITGTFVINGVIVVAISHILSANYWNSKEFLAVPLVAMEGYSSKLIIFTGPTTVIRDANMVAIGK
jgi:hypothetical protein